MAFSDQALNKFLQTHQELTPNIVSFTDMTDQLPEDDVNANFGVFILKSGNEFFFVPALARNDVLFPMDLVFFNSDSKFFPMTESVVQLISSALPSKLGTTTKVPKTVTRNPDISDMVNPPRTGKFVYASSRLEEFLANSPKSFKEGFKEHIMKEASFQEPLNRMFGMRNIFESLASESNMPETQGVEKKAEADYFADPRVITDGENLPDHVIQEILDKGYAVLGRPRSPRIVNLSPRHESGPATYKQVSQVDIGSAHNFLLRSGGTVQGYLPQVVSIDLSDPVVLFEDGTYSRLSSLRKGGGGSVSANAIITSEECTSEDVISNLLQASAPVRLGNVYPEFNGSERREVAIFDDRKLLGVFEIQRRTDANGVTTFSTSGSSKSRDLITIRDIPATRVTPEAIYLDPDSVCVPVSQRHADGDELEVSLRRAEATREARVSAGLEKVANVKHDAGEYFYEGQRIGPEKDMVERLVVGDSLNPEAAINIVKVAEKKGNAVFYMSKEASSWGSSQGEIPSYGNQPPEQASPYPERRMKQNLDSAMQTNDPAVVESTIVSEILQDPDMFSSIEHYLPDLASAIDRLGRILLLTRLHSDLIFGESDATETTSLLAATKNCFKSLGNNYLTLERLVANAKIASQ